jgi:hypothetical protein
MTNTRYTYILVSYAGLEFHVKKGMQKLPAEVACRTLILGKAPRHFFKGTEAKAWGGA